MSRRERHTAEGKSFLEAGEQMTSSLCQIVHTLSDSIRFLIAKGGDVNLTDSHGITALDDATNRSYMGVVEILKRAGAKCGTNHHYSKNCKQASGSG